MTQAQKTAKDKFKKAIAYRTKTGCSLKAAFAHIYGKKVISVKKKAAPKNKAAVKKNAPKKVGAAHRIKASTKKISGLHKKSVVSGINKSMLGLLKEYIAVYNFANGSSDYEMFKATSLAEAKKFAQFHKRKENIKGKLSVKLIKK